MSNPEDKVVFRVWPNGDVIALFPAWWAGGDCCQSYEHVGQHGAANYAYIISRTRPASADGLQPLLDELRQIGDMPVVIQRSTRQLSEYRRR